MPEPTIADRVWAELDEIVAAASLSSPWTGGADDRRYVPDIGLLERLMESPLRHNAPTQSGMPAKAIDVWVAHELRRAGFEADEVWPRAAVPRVLPREVGLLRTTSGLRAATEELFRRIDGDQVRGGVASADAKILGKTYEKQVDVVMAQWARGPEVLISTKRMDSSFGKNAFNRIEESYGDAKNLRGRHPMAATGFLFGIRSTGFTDEKASVLRLIDLLEKLAKEPDAYDATGLIVIDYPDAPDDKGKRPIKIRHDLTPPALAPERFMQTMVEAVLDRTPIDYHIEARRRWGQEAPADDSTTTETIE